MAAKDSNPDNPFSAEVEAKLKAFPPAKQKNLRITLAKYERGQTSQWEEKKLREADLIDTPGGDATTGDKEQQNSDICDTHAEIASRMLLHYQNPDKSSKLRIEIGKGTISDWCAGKRLDGKPMPPKPLAGMRRRWSLRAWLAWFDAHMWHEYRANAHQTNGTAPAKMSTAELREITEREELEHKRWEIVKDMGGYISVPLAERHAAGFSRQYHDQWKTRNEKSLIEAFTVKAQSLNIEPEKIAVLEQFLTLEHQKFTDAVEIASEKFAGELAEKLKAESQQEQP